MARRFEIFLENFGRDFKLFGDREKNLVLEKTLTLCGPEQLRFLSDELHNIVKRDFIKFLPSELAFSVLRFLDFKSFSRCCLVSKAWNRILSNFTEVWTESCKRLGVVGQKCTKTVDWKLEFRKGFRRLKRFRRYRNLGFAKRELDGHEQRVTALCYKDGLLASGSDDRTVRLWDVASGTCKYNLMCHTSCDLKFDELQVVTASGDCTLARWEWATGNCLTKYQGHVGAVFCVDYNIELDLVVSGSSDHTIKLWRLSTGLCLATKLGHQNWLISVLIAQIAQEYHAKLQRKHVVISMSRECIKVWSTLSSEEYGCLATLSNQSESCCVLQFMPKLLCNGRDIICSSDQGVCIWSLETFQLTRLFKKHDHILVAFGDIFSLCWKNNNLHILNNKTEDCLCEMPAYWSKPKYRYIDCAGETAWLSDCSQELESGPIYFARDDKTIVIIQWSMDSKIVDGIDL